MILIKNHPENSNWMSANSNMSKNDQNYGVFHHFSAKKLDFDQFFDRKLLLVCSDHNWGI
jgi:hypothetical protein